MRELAGGKPTGFKLCVGSRRRGPGHLQGDGRGGHDPGLHRRRRLRGRHRRGAAGVRGPRRHAAHRRPDDSCTTRWSATGLRDRIRIGASGKVADRQRHRQAAHPGRRLHQRRPGDDDGRRLHPGAACHTNKCPVGVATQDPRRARALDVGGQERARRAATSRRTVDEAMQMMASMGAHRPARADAAPCCATSSATCRPGPTPSSTTGSRPGSCSPSRPRTGPHDWAAAEPGLPSDPACRAPRSDRHDHRRRASSSRRSPTTGVTHGLGRGRRRPQPGHRRDPPRGPHRVDRGAPRGGRARSPPARRPSSPARSGCAWARSGPARSTCSTASTTRRSRTRRCWPSAARCRCAEIGTRLLPGGRQRRAVRDVAVFAETLTSRRAAAPPARAGGQRGARSMRGVAVLTLPGDVGGLDARQGRRGPPTFVPPAHPPPAPDAQRRGRRRRPDRATPTGHAARRVRRARRARRGARARRRPRGARWC